MSSRRTARLLLRTYPPSWRARYGEELATLMQDARDRGRARWHAPLDVALSGARERLRASGVTGDGVPPEVRSRAGTLLVLCAWSLFVVAGLTVERISEHWRAAMPPPERALPAHAFAVLVVAAVAGTALVVAGGVCTAPALLAFLRAGRFGEIRARWVRAAWLTAASTAASLALVVWAHRLAAPARNGRDVAYALGFSAACVLLIACLAAWTLAIVATAQRIDLPVRVLARLAAGVTAAMAAMTAATAVWWSALPAGSPVAGSPALAGALVVMGIATILGAAGSRRALATLPARR